MSTAGIPESYLDPGFHPSLAAWQVRRQSKCPEYVAQYFIDLGAVRWSRLILEDDRRGYWDSPRVTHLWDAIVTFWNAQGREIGHYNVPCDAVAVFAPNYRDWHPSCLEREDFVPITRPEEPSPCADAIF
jgi:hypothetical protein